LKGRIFNANAIEAGKHDGKLYAIPFYLDVGLFFYRKDILDNSDKSISLEDLKQSLNKLKNKNKEGLIFQGGPYEGLICTFLDLHNLLNINDGDLKIEENGDVRLDTDEILKTIKFIHSCMHKDEIKIIPLSVFGYDEYNSRDSFIEGHAVVLRSWPFVIQNSKKNIGVLNFENSRPVLRGWYLAIPESSDHKEEAWELIKYLTKKDEQHRRATEYKEKRFPPEQSVIDGLEGSYPWLNKVRKAIQNSTPPPSLPNYMDFSREFSKTLFRILSKREISDEEIKRQLRECEDKINKTNPKKNYNTRLEDSL
jgi:multiple sugar transport system substrate-binding protein